LEPGRSSEVGKRRPVLTPPPQKTAPLLSGLDVRRVKPHDLGQVG